MGLPDERIAYLLEAYTSRKATAPEEQELMEWMQDAEEDSALKLYMQDIWNKYQPGTDQSPVNWEGMLSRILSGEEIPSLTGKRRWLNWSRMAAAAAVIVLAGAIAYFWPQNSNRTTTVAGKSDEQQHDRKPGHEGAVLTLSDGRQMVLDSLGNGKIAVENGGEVMLRNGQLSYVNTGKQTGAIAFNTMSTPKGRQFKLTLPDGTAVWLNSASSIRYPTAFTGKDRRVAITGEAYFEVAQQASKPFVVDVNGKSEIQVLGTHFNVNAYQDRGLVKTTLFEGSVKVQTPSKLQLLKPGQQAQVATDASIILLEKADTEQVIAWKNGLFNFNNEDIRSALEEIGRWYDMEIVYESEPAQVEITGEMQRNLSLSQVMNVLKKLHINYKLEGKKLIIIE